MAHHQLIPLDSPSGWNEALKGIKHGFGHTWKHCYAVSLTSGFRTYLYYFENGNSQVVCPIAEREYDGYLDIVKPFGFAGFVGSGDCPEFAHHWNEFARQRGYIAGYLGLHPILENNLGFEADEIHQYNTVHVLDLTLSREELFANLSSNRRRQFRDWDNIVSNLVLERSVVKDFFLANYYDFIDRKIAASHYYLSKDTLSCLADSDNVLIVGAQGSEGLEAVSVFTYSSEVGDYLFNISIPSGRHHAAAILWYAANHFKSLEIPFFNLGGSVRENDGIAEFKRRFGTYVLPLRCLKQVYDLETLKALCERVNADPNDRAGYFPPYRKSAK